MTKKVYVVIGTYGSGHHAPNPWDEDMRIDYTGTDYTVSEVSLLRAVPRPVPS